MTALLTALFGRLPIGWLQLVHNRSRLLAALFGVAFANILIFMQLGFLGALQESAVLPYRAMAADILIYASDTNTLADSGTLPRQRLFQALAVPGVADATPVYLARFDWTQANGKSSSMQVFGVDPEAAAFADPEIEAARARLRLLDTALLDRRTRNLDPAVAAALASGGAYAFEAEDRTLSVEGLFTLGPGFESDGHLVVSDQTFLRLFPRRVAGAPNYAFVTVEPGADPRAVVARLRAALPASDTVVRTLDDAAAADQAYQTTERPVGVVFGFGVVIGVLVGIIIVYQVLATDVADHMGEYATFKAIGYRQRFFLGVVFEEALLLAALGFVPGLLAALALYQLAAAGTGLPVTMTPLRPPLVFVGTLLMCAASGAVATRRLAKADPAELF